MNRFRGTMLLGLVLTMVGPAASRVSADDRIGGHFGVVFPLIARTEGETTTIADDFVIGFPVGITVRPNASWAFDLELVPNVQNDPVDVALTVHPGVLRDLGSSWTAGLRVAFEVNGDAWGFTPLLNKGFPVGNHAFFIEADVPIRFHRVESPFFDRPDETSTSIGFAVHVGIGF